MQNDTITLSVDVTNSGSPTSEPYTRHEELANRSTYIGADHTLADRNTLQFYRTPPRRNGEFLGAAKTSLKFTQDTSVANASGDGNIVAPLIMEVQISAPVGVTEADLVHLRQRVLAVLDDDSVSGPLMFTQEI